MNVLFIDDDIDFSLIGIHSTERAYRLAFLLNKWTQTYMIKSKDERPFELFEYEDELNFVSFYLIKNKYYSRKKVSVGFFEEEIMEVNYVIPEKKEVDYFIKIHDCESSFLKSFLNKLKKIREIQTSYEIDVENLKTKQNLIF